MNIRQDNNDSLPYGRLGVHDVRIIT